MDVRNNKPPLSVLHIGALEKFLVYGKNQFLMHFNFHLKEGHFCVLCKLLGKNIFVLKEKFLNINQKSHLEDELCPALHRLKYTFQNSSRSVLV